MSTLPVYRIGDLVWCRWSTIKWPAMVTYDPNQAIFFKKTGRVISHYHVQYFGVKAQRGWVKSGDIVRLETNEKFVLQHTKKSLQLDYEVAIKEVKQAKKLGLKQRKLCFIFNYENRPKINHKKRKCLPLNELDGEWHKEGSKKIDDDLTAATSLTIDMNTATRIPVNQDLLTPPSTNSDVESVDLCSVGFGENQFSNSFPQKRMDTNYCLQTSACDICSSQHGIEFLACSGQCFRKFHLDCLGLALPPKFTFVCDDCILSPSACFLCKTTDGELTACSHIGCEKKYHLLCAFSSKHFDVDPITKVLKCPLHKCAKCSDRRSSTLIQCTKCPFALHKKSCLIAGCETLENGQMICHQHLVVNSSFPQSLRHINLNSCLECGQAGTLICCEFCPATYHLDCLPEENQPEEDNKWLCPSCSKFDLPIYSSIVLCKCGNYRWWPAELVSEKSIPNHMLASKPAKGFFLVLFYGTGQYHWTNHGRVISFTDDCNWVEKHSQKLMSTNHQTNKVMLAYAKAYEEALTAFKEQELKKVERESYEKGSKLYCPIKKNKYLVPKPALEQETEPCDCTINDSCSSASHCINKDLFIECSPLTCPVGDKCKNQRMRQQRSAKTSTFHTGKRGWGLRTKENLRKGDFVIEYIGEVMDRGMCLERLKESQAKSVSNYYFLTLKGNLVIDASCKSNHARFINHSCNPNCTTEKWTVDGETRIGIFAIIDIPAESELTFDYRLECLGNEKMKCFCGADNCSGFLGEKPKTNLQLKSHTTDPTKNKQSRKRKAKRRNTCTKYPKLDDTHEDECFICKEGGSVILCDYEDCSKVYHTKCLHLQVIPDSFICPLHICSRCSNEAVQKCRLCPTSFCKEHIPSQQSDGDYHCQKCMS